MAQFNQILSALGHKDFCNFKFFLAQVQDKILNVARNSHDAIKCVRCHFVGQK